MKLAVLANVFPPRGGPGAVRYAHLCRQWVLMGHEVHVVTAAIGWHDDSRLLELVDIPGLYVHRIGGDQGADAHREPSRLDTLRARLKSSGQTGNSALRLLARIAKSLRDSMAIPDEHLLRVVPWARALENVVRDAGCDVVLTTSYPYSSHLAGLRFKRRNPHIRWVMELRDPWAGHVFRGRDRGFAGSLDSWMERHCVDAVDGLAVISPTMVRRVRERYGDELDVRCIPNGFEASGEAGTPPPSPPWTLLYTGTFDHEWEPVTPILDTLDSMFNAEAKLAEQVRLVWAGGADLPSAHAISRFASRWPSVIVSLGYRPFEEMAALRSSSHALLLSLVDGAPVFTTKLFEYVESGRPIVAWVGAGDCRDFLREAGNVWFGDDGSESLAERLRRALREQGALELGTRDFRRLDGHRYDSLATSFLELLAPYSPYPRPLAAQVL